MAHVTTEVPSTPAQPVPTARDRYHTGAFVVILVAGVVGLLASLELSIDAVRLAEDPLADLSCNISSTISCATVGLSSQASLLGFPNAFLGLITQPVMITIAVAALGGVRFPRWFMLGAHVGFTLGLAFAIWLFVQSYFVIGALCPYCMILYVTTLAAFAAITRVNVLEGFLGAGAKRSLERPLRLGLDTAAVVIILAVVASMTIYKYL
jgi:uncharacterized membrane protein